MKLARWVREYSLTVIALVVVLLAWEVAVRVGRIPAFVLPAPSAIGARFAADLALLRLHTLVTVHEILAGYAVAAVTGLAIAVLIVQFKTFERVVYPWVIASQTVPKIAVAPLLIIWLGSGLVPKILIVAVTAFFPITVNAVAGFRAVDENYLNLLRSVAATPRPGTIQRIVPVSLPRPRERHVKIADAFMDHVRILHAELYKSMEA